MACATEQGALKSVVLEEEQQQLCEICYDELQKSDFVLTCPEHSYCRFCIRLYAQTCLGSGSDPTCPTSGCGAVLPIRVLRKVGGESLVNRDRQMRLVRVQRQNPLSRWCPKCNTHTLKQRGTSKKAVCTSKACAFEFCAKCGGRHHSWPCLRSSSRTVQWWASRKSVAQTAADLPLI